MSDRREYLKRRIEGLERKLSIVPKDAGSVAASQRHADLQIAYWRLRQVLASVEARNAAPEDRHGHQVETRKCAEVCAEWERRKAEAVKNHDVISRLDEIDRKLEAKAKAASKLSVIKTG